MGHNRGEFLVVNGYRFNHWLSAGIGTGIQVTLPLFADVEVTFMQKTISSYTDLRLGSCWGLPEDEVLPRDGVYFSPAIGFR